MNWPAVQSGVQPQMENRKFSRISPPRGVWATPGLNTTPLLVDPVAGAGPHGDGLPRREPGEQTRAAPDLDFRPAVFSLRGWLHFATGKMGHQLHAVTNAEHRDAKLEKRGIRAGGALVEHRVGAARQDDPFGRRRTDEGQIAAPGGRGDLAVEARVAHPSRDELGELRAVVQDQDAATETGHASRHAGVTVSPRIRSSVPSRSRTTA